jgi:serine/threonine protein kinase
MATRANNGEYPTWDDTRKFVVIYGTAVGMKILHAHNVIHRNLKPNNVLLDANFEPRICRFGYSKFFDPDSPLNQSTWSGTLIFIAPGAGQHGDLVCGIPVDVYSFGMLVYVVTVSPSPFAGIKGSQARMKAVAEGKRPEIPSNVIPGYKDLISKCWKGNPDERPSFADIVEDLGANFARFGKVDEVRF